jgi:hypothetical protein
MSVVAIGLGLPKHAQHYCGRIAPSLGNRCLSELSTEPYETWGLREGTLGSFVSPDFIKAGIRVARAGLMPEKPTGNFKMLPGTFIVDREGRVQFAHYSKHAGDHPAIPTLIEVGTALAQVTR